MDGVCIEAAFLMFSDRHGRACEVYAERCLIDRSNAPSLLHCPGGGQTVNRADLLDWAHKGFSSVSFDWQIGDFPEHDPARKSHWPDGVVGQNHYIRLESEAILPLAIQAAGVCIEWLVDSGRINGGAVGVTGISWGGYLTWLIAAYSPALRQPYRSTAAVDTSMNAIPGLGISGRKSGNSGRTTGIHFVTLKGRPSRSATFPAPMTFSASCHWPMNC